MSAQEQDREWYYFSRRVPREDGQPAFETFRTKGEPHADAKIDARNWEMLTRSIVEGSVLGFEFQNIKGSEGETPLLSEEEVNARNASLEWAEQGSWEKVMGDEYVRFGTKEGKDYFILKIDQHPQFPVVGE